MDIPSALRPLGPVDSALLATQILAAGEDVWNEYVERQKSFEVHEQTRSIVLLFADVTGWPAAEVSRQPGWPRFAAAAVPLMQDILRRAYPPGGTVIRAMAARLLTGGRIAPHRDAHPSFGAAHRIHVPLATSPRVRFTIGGQAMQLETGHAYEINNQQIHSVMNNSPADRIHFIFDYLPPGAQVTVTGAGTSGVPGELS